MEVEEEGEDDRVVVGSEGAEDEGGCKVEGEDEDECEDEDEEEEDGGGLDDEVGRVWVWPVGFGGVEEGAVVGTSSSSSVLGGTGVDVEVGFGVDVGAFVGSVDVLGGVTDVLGGTWAGGGCQLDCSLSVCYSETEQGTPPPALTPRR